MIRPGNKTANDIQTSTRTTHELFQLLVDDIHRLMTRKSKIQEQENEGRTSAMRAIRQLRDWIVDRSTVLNTLHSTISPLGYPRFAPSRNISQSHGQFLKMYKSPDHSGSSHIASPPAIMARGHVSDPNSSFGHDPLTHPPFATSTPQPTDPQATDTPSSPGTLIQPISSVVEGVHQLENQLREYIHLEIMLTDKFRHEMRMKQHQKKALGFSNKGISEAQDIVKRLSKSGSSELETIHKLKGQLDRIFQEYQECSKYMDKVVSSMAQIDDVEMFLKNIHEREKEYRKKMNKAENIKENDKKKSKGKEKETEKSKSKDSGKTKSQSKDPYESLAELFSTGNQMQHHHFHQNTTRNVPEKNPRSSMTKSHFLPSINSGSRDIAVLTPPIDDLLVKLKLLVANYEIVRLRMLTMEDRYRRESSKRERRAESLIKARDDEICRLQALLREAEAEKEKFHRLYDNTKIAVGRRR